MVNLPEAAPRKRKAAAAKLAPRHRQRVLVRPARHTPLQHLRGRILGSHAALVALDVCPQQTHQAEVTDLDSLTDEQDVLRFNVAVLDADRLGAAHKVTWLVEIVDDPRRLL